MRKRVETKVALSIILAQSRITLPTYTQAEGLATHDCASIIYP